MAPLIALAFKLLPLLSAVPEAVDALKGKDPLGAAKVILGAASEATGQKDPAKAIASIEADPGSALRFQELMSGERVRMAELALDETKAFMADTQDARARFAADKGVYRLGIVILITFAVIMGLALFGAYKLLLDDDLKLADPGIVAAVFGFLGTAVGYVAANAQQVVSYFFGSSRGSTDKSQHLAEAVKKLAE